MSLAPVPSRFGDFVARELEVISAANADICRGEQAVGVRGWVALADANCGVRSGFSTRRLDSNFLTQISNSFGSTADLSARPPCLLGTLVYRIPEKRPQARHCRQPATGATAKCHEE